MHRTDLKTLFYGSEVEQSIYQWGKKLSPIDNVGDTKKVEDDLKTIYDVQIIGMSNLERYKAYGVQSMS